METTSPRRDAQKREERPRQAARRITSNTNHAKHTTRDERRAYLVAAMAGTPVLSFAGHLDRLRARLTDALLDETPDQQAEARAWGERCAS